MANHVTASLRFERINEAGKEILKSKTDRLEKYGENDSHGYHMGYLITDDLTTINRNTMIEEFGAKWAYADYWDEDSINIVSAWDPCSTFVESLVEEIAAVDPDVLAIHTYEDECYNFVGVDAYDSEGIYDCCRLDDEEILEMMLEEVDGLRDVWDEEEEEWKDDGDLYLDNIHEVIDKWLYESEQSIV